jgi:hypothetical protein
MQNKDTNRKTKAVSASASRRTITLEPYFWEAYNAIVQPERRDWYLIRRWARTLGPLGFMIVKVLRSLCYFNPKTGETRNTIELDMDELADYCGVSRRTIIREFQTNTPLACFVTKQSQYVLVGTRAKRQDSRYFVAMDEPIHPEDMAEYERLKLERQGRTTAPPKTVVHRSHSDRCHSVTYHSGDRCHFVTHGGQIVTGPGQIVPPDGQIVTYLPTVVSDSSVLLSTSTTAALPPKPDGLPPEGASGLGDTLCCESLWRAVLPRMAATVNKPTFEAHIRTLVPVSLSAAPETTPDAPHSATNRVLTLRVASPFTRDWLEKRHTAALNEALSESAGEPIAVRLVLESA